MLEFAMHIRKGDVVEVLTGNSSGTRGPVLSVDRKNGKLVVEGVNRVLKHVKRGHPKSPQGGRLQTELAIDASNVALIDPQTNKPTKVSVRINADGSKDLVARKSGAVIRVLAPARK
ncbi:MAG: 50S ribosomal protein L24 [Planctomycetaceae bacterium]